MSLCMEGWAMTGRVSGAPSCLHACVNLAAYIFMDRYGLMYVHACIHANKTYLRCTRVYLNTKFVYTTFENLVFQMSRCTKTSEHIRHDLDGKNRYRIYDTPTPTCTCFLSKQTTAYTGSSKQTQFIGSKAVHT